MPVRLSRVERREKTRQDLLTAAEACFVTRGFHATSVDEVAEQAGYTKGAVYSNFASKEDLFSGSTSGGSSTCSPRWYQAYAKPGQNERSTGWPRGRSSGATATTAGWRSS